jgi:hypothetical protein
MTIFPNKPPSYETEAVTPPQIDIRAKVIKRGMMKNVNVRRKMLT